MPRTGSSAPGPHLVHSPSDGTADPHAFVGSENTGHGLQVLDVTEVRGVTGDPITFSETAHYGSFSNSHNLAVNEDTGYLYAVGS